MTPNVSVEPTATAVGNPTINQGRCGSAQTLGWAAGERRHDMLQDQCKELSRWLATRPGARRQAKGAAMDQMSVSEKVGGHVDLPMPTHCAAELLVLACRRCGGPMKPGLAMGQTLRSGSPDFIGGQVVTMSAGGPGKLIECLKCEACGHSVTPNV